MKWVLITSSTENMSTLKEDTKSQVLGKKYKHTGLYGHRIIFLPPYLPDLNRIENFWAWLKGKLEDNSSI